MGDNPFVDVLGVQAVPWKNGGGVTRELAHRDGPNGFAWRLSVADVAKEGAFSTFPSMSRILTVIDGNGLELHSAEQVFDVPLGKPFSFSGETPIKSVLRNGPIRDFNVIFDAALVDADVSVRSGLAQLNMSVGPADTYAVFAMVGAFRCNGATAPQGSFALFESGTMNISVPEASRLLVVRLTDC